MMKGLTTIAALTTALALLAAVAITFAYSGGYLKLSADTYSAPSAVPTG